MPPSEGLTDDKEGAVEDAADLGSGVEAAEAAAARAWICEEKGFQLLLLLREVSIPRQFSTSNHSSHKACVSRLRPRN